MRCILITIKQKSGVALLKNKVLYILEQQKGTPLFEEIIRENLTTDFIEDKQVLVADANHSYVTTVTGIDEPGALIVKNGYGTVQHITTGEIKLNWGNQR